MPQNCNFFALPPANLYDRAKEIGAWALTFYQAERPKILGELSIKTAGWSKRPPELYLGR